MSRTEPRTVATLAPEAVDAIVARALAEDLRPAAGTPRAACAGGGDATSDLALSASQRAEGRLVAKDVGRLAGLEVFGRVFELAESELSRELGEPARGIEFERLAVDGDELVPGRVVARVRGRARTLLRAERTALNLVQRMSGTATATARCVAAAGGAVRILDTRKTTPGLRLLEKYAVRCGGGENHRYGLFDEAMVKNNHLDLAGRALREVVADLRARLGPAVRITAEARDEEEARQGVLGGADVILLDNMAPARMADLVGELRALARRERRDVEIEASGGVSLTTLPAIAASGVDRVSVGALTHSAAALDFSLYLSRLDGGAAGGRA